MFHILFIHSSISGHLGCFDLLVLVNGAAVNMGAQSHINAFHHDPASLSISDTSSQFHPLLLGKEWGGRTV